MPDPLPDDPALAWFDRFLKGEKNGIGKGPAAWYHDLGSDQWKHSSRWPPKDSELVRFYLSGEPSGTHASVEDGSLRREPPTTQLARKEDRYVYDPTVGVSETLSKWGTVALTPHIRVDQRPDEARALTYTTPHLEQSLRLAGPMELHFWGSTTASNTDWIAKVTDVAPDGSSTLLTSGYVRAPHRTWDPQRSQPGEPWLPNLAPANVPAGKILEYRVPIWDIAHALRPGHRLRITISSADVPNHEPLPQPAVNAVFHEPAYPSELLLTVRDRD